MQYLLRTKRLCVQDGGGGCWFVSRITLKPPVLLLRECDDGGVQLPLTVFPKLVAHYPILTADRRLRGGASTSQMIAQLRHKPIRGLNYLSKLPVGPSCN